MEYDIQDAGDESLSVVFGNSIKEEYNDYVIALHDSLRESVIKGVEGSVPAYASLLISYSPCCIRRSKLIRIIKKRLSALKVRAKGESTVHSIPVCYCGEDLSSVATHAGMTRNEVIALHSSTPYRIYMLGFLPGFPYLGGLDSRIHTPRLSTPRMRIPPGSVGIGGEQTGIYPLSSPGGWNIIGRTDAKLYDPKRAEPILFKAGDYIRFVPVPSIKEDTEAERETVSTGSSLFIEDGGMLSSIQDIGRTNGRDMGFSKGGAADCFSYMIANMLVGNVGKDAYLPAIEMTYTGIKAVFNETNYVSVCGAGFRIRVDGQYVPMNAAIKVLAGSRLECEPFIGGIRAYIAVSGGFKADMLLGSGSTDMRCHIGGYMGRKLRFGDVLSFNKPSDTLPDIHRRKIDDSVFKVDKDIYDIRVVMLDNGQFSQDGIKTFLSNSYMVTDKSDRMGMRLAGPSITHKGNSDIISEGIPIGTVQIPSSGMPIITLCDSQTTGGYTRIATVCSCDIHILSQLSPNASVRFKAVSIKQAQKQLAEYNNMINRYMKYFIKRGKGHV